ncbi:AEC family transporter [Aliterella atlantica]|uniref:Transporter n=1 Tax=Aliterella atlantica CENA595 TaxID=1618023 RepID=A0A0D8ZRP0_9CYAN|nr:AEC family transporter [Aliterella atlantica]KJH71473.1 transporter [Aliterella atlantica CENA595]
MTTSIFWTSLGVLLFRLEFLPLKENLPQLLGRSLYWVGVPLQILALARRSDFTQAVWLPPAITLEVLLLGMGLAILSLYLLKQLAYWQKSRLTSQLQLADRQRTYQLPIVSKLLPQQRSGKGSFVLASMLGNTGFIGLAIAPAFVDSAYLGWVVLYGVTHNILGSYGLGVVLASYFGRQTQKNQWWMQLRDVMCVPSLWAFAIGYFSRHLEFPPSIEWGIQTSLLFVIPGAFLLIGMQLSKLQGVKSFYPVIIPAVLKMLVLPALAGVILTYFGITGDARFALVLMSGMPTAFANLILAEEYNLDRQIAASSIVLTTVGLPLTIPLWLFLFK